MPFDFLNFKHDTTRTKTVLQSDIAFSIPHQNVSYIKCPNKVKIFAWRLAHNSLPLRRKIKGKGIDLDTACPMCERMDEDASHMLFKCKFSKGVWRELQMEQYRLEMKDSITAKEVFYTMWKYEKEMQVKLIILLWALYSERNRVNAGERIHSDAQVAAQVQSFFLEFCEFFAKTTKITQAQDNHKWKKPSPGFLKVNLDAAYDELTKTGGWGFIIRNGKGGVEVAGAGQISAAGSVLQAEAIACFQALQIAAQQGMMKVELETDCSNLKNAISSNDWDMAPEGMMFREIKFFAASSFPSNSLQHPLSLIFDLFVCQEIVMQLHIC